MNQVWHKNTVMGKLCSEQVIMKYTLQNSEKKFQKYEKKVQKSCQTSFWPVLMHALKRKKGEAMSEVEIAGLHHTYIGEYKK